MKLWYPAPWVGNTNVPHSAERKGELAYVSRFLTYVMASSRMGDHGRTHKGQANECPWGADFLPLHATPKVVMLAGWALSRWHHERAPNLSLYSWLKVECT